MHKIGKGIRPEDLEPATGKPRGRAPKYPVGDLARGEHFAVTLPDLEPLTRKRKVQTLQRAISRYRQTNPRPRFVVRYSPEDNALYVIRLEEDDLP